MRTDLQLRANRENAQSSTGPTTAMGKAVVGRNATRHGLLSARLFLEDEDPAEFQVLADDLAASLAPVGAVEVTLVERIAVTIWRQRRLVQAETAALALARQPVPTAKSVTAELGRTYGTEVKVEHLQPFDTDRDSFCRAALAEIDSLEQVELNAIKARAPTVYGQLSTEAEGQGVDAFLAGHAGGLKAYISELILWCRRERLEAQARPHLLTLAERVRAKCMVPPVGSLELLSRYQTTLDNQLYKALRALRETQEWRLKTLEASCSANIPVDIGASEMA